MKSWTSSIRRQLLCWLLVPIFTLWVVGAAITYILAIDFANNAYDNALLDSARAVSSRLSFQNNKTTVDLPPAAQDILKYNERDDFFFQVLTSRGRLLSGDDTVPSPAWPDLSKNPGLRDAKIGAHDVRIVTIEVPIPNRPNNDFVVIQVAETLQGREQLMDNIILGVVLPQFVLIVLAGLAVWFGVTRGLRPLKELQGAVESRSPSDLRPVPIDTAPKEVKPLVNAINRLLMRVREDREAQKRFVANAAHQLRTPLAGLKTQTELAVRNRDPEELRHSLRQIRTSADRATRLVHQLLSLARVEPAAFKTTQIAPVDINSVARDATAELVPQALDKQIDLGFEGLLGEHCILGDTGSIYEMASNLIENAILYTHRGGKVTVRVEQDEYLRLVIEDNGPGIPEAERELVFERFYRALGNDVSGSGLGLSIVREIAESHNARVRLSAGPDNIGTTAIVEFTHTTDLVGAMRGTAGGASMSFEVPLITARPVSTAESASGKM
jgi:two-component system sensor histidine kinase TctE